MCIYIYIYTRADPCIYMHGVSGTECIETEPMRNQAVSSNSFFEYLGAETLEFKYTRIHYAFRNSYIQKL